MRLGIDLGTCSTRAAWRKQGETHFVPNPSRGTFGHPTAGYCSDNCRLLIGQQAEARRDHDPANYWGEFKRDLGSGAPRLLGNRLFQAEELATALLRHLREQAGKIAGEDFKGTILTVPVAFEGYRREQFEQAARQAGFEQVEMLTEPEAAALYVESSDGVSLPEERQVLVYDLGGGTFDAALFQRKQSRLELIAGPVGARDLGGRELDCVLLNEVLRTCPPLREEVRRGTLASRRLLRVLEDCCRERGKHVLSESDDVEILLPPEFTNTWSLTRGEFLNLVKGLLDRTVVLCRDLLGRDRQPPAVTVVMVGGSCRLPFVAEWIQNAFPQAVVVRASDPDLAVCRGAVLLAAERDAEDGAAGDGSRRRRFPGPYQVRPLW